MRSRRDILRTAVASLLCGAVASRGARAQAGRRGAPRYFVSVLLSGGVDPVYTTDPKRASEVDPAVDVPYGPDAIVDAGGLQLGPHLGPLAPLAGRLAVVNGIQLRTANHNTGSEQFLRFRTGTRPEMPSLLALLGQHRDGQAVGSMDWLFAAPQFARLFGSAHPEELLRLSAILRAQGRRLLADAGSASHVTAGSLEESAALLERVAALPPLRAEVWSAEEGAQQLALALQRILWLLEHDLTRCYELNVGGIDQPWDTHTFNAERQATASRPVAMIARFLAELSRRRTARGLLADQTLVVMGSEIGRFPMLNTQHGKDHFPEAPCLFYGAGINAGASYGRTGRKMDAAPVSLKTGRDTAAGGHRISLDDVGATLLYLGGVADPTVYGYDGRVLEFLVGA